MTKSFKEWINFMSLTTNKYKYNTGVKKHLVRVTVGRRFLLPDGGEGKVLSNTVKDGVTIEIGMIQSVIPTDLATHIRVVEE